MQGRADIYGCDVFACSTCAAQVDYVGVQCYTLLQQRACVVFAGFYGNGGACCSQLLQKHCSTGTTRQVQRGMHVTHLVADKRHAGILLVVLLAVLLVVLLHCRERKISTKQAKDGTWYHSSSCKECQEGLQQQVRLAYGAAASQHALTDTAGCTCSVLPEGAEARRTYVCSSFSLFFSCSLLVAQQKSWHCD